MRQEMQPISIRAIARSTGLVPIALAVALSACSSNKKSTASHSPDQPAQTSDNELRASLHQSAKKYKSKPKSKKAILNYASALRANGQINQAVAVLSSGMVRTKGDKDIASAYGKGLAAAGNSWRLE